jgi:uncharacterized protein (TIGR00290 family)
MAPWKQSDSIAMSQNREPIALCWSGGKDSSLALHALRDDPRFQLAALVTTFTEGYNRVSIHGVRYELLRDQADAIGLPLEEVWIPQHANNQIYEMRMAETLTRLKESQGVRAVAFGDIFLEDLKLYRETQLARLSLGSLFPLWKRDTAELARVFVQSGFRGVTTCIDPRRLSSAYVGRELDEAFFSDLPADCDACGENGEFHSFVYQAPGWSREISFSRGEIVNRDSFLFCDLLPHSLATSPNAQ